MLLAALYVLLKPVNRGLALLAALWRFVWVLMWLSMTLNLYDALRLLRWMDSLGAGEVERVQRLAMVYQVWDRALTTTTWDCCSGRWLRPYGAYLWLKTDYIPRGLAIFGVASSAWCAANLWWFDTPMGLFDIGTSWLLFKGLRTPVAMQEP